MQALDRAPAVLSGLERLKASPFRSGSGSQPSKSVVRNRLAAGPEGVLSAQVDQWIRCWAQTGSRRVDEVIC